LFILPAAMLSVGYLLLIVEVRFYRHGALPSMQPSDVQVTER